MLRTLFFVSLVCVLIVTPRAHAQSPHGSRVFEPGASARVSSTEDEFRAIANPKISLFGSEAVLGSLNSEDAPELADAYGRLLSLNLFERGHLRAAREMLRASIERDPQANHRAESQLLSALELLSSRTQTREELRFILSRFDDISSAELAAEPPLEGEYYFWQAEVRRALDEHRTALAYYDSALALPLPHISTTHILYRKAELEEHILLSEEARRDYDSLAVMTAPNPFRLFALMRAASMLRAQGRYALLRARLGAIAVLLRDSSALISSELVNDGYHSLYLRLLCDPSLRRERITSTADRGLPDSATTKLYAPKYAEVYYRVLEASVQSALRHFDSSLAVLNDADSILHTGDSLQADTPLRRYLHHLVEFERGWASLENGDNLQAAKIFTALADDDSLSANAVRFVRPLSDYTGTFYSDADARPLNQMPTSSAEPIERGFYDDVPARARFYLGIALFRAGKFERARDILTALSQDQTAIYSDKARYHLALVEFTSKHTITAEALLEDVATRRTRAGIYSAILLGDINYRKMNFAKSAEYFGFALANLSSYDTLLIAVSSLERGLCLVALGGWTDAAHDLGEFVRRATPTSPGLDEALFWYGRALLRIDSVAEARAIFKRLLDEFPKSERRIDGEYGYAWSLFRAGDYQHADKSFERVMKLDSITRYAYDALSRRGDAQYAAGNMQRASKIYNLAVDRPTFDDYRTARSMFQLGVIRMRSDSARSAINAFNYIINKLPQSDLLDRCYYNIAVAAYAIKQTDRANEAAQTIFKKYTSSQYAPKVAYLQAGQREHEGDNAGAYVAYRRVVREYPNAQEYTAALFGALGSLVKLERHDEAIKLADSMYRRNGETPYSSRLLYLKGEIELDADKPNAAHKTFEQFAKSYPHDTLYPMARVMSAKSILAAKGSREDARAILSDLTTAYAQTSAASFAYLELARMAKKDDESHVAPNYVEAYDLRYFSSDAAPTAMYEYATYLRDVEKRSDSSNAVFDALTKRYLVQTNIGAKAQLQIVESLIGSGERTKAIARLEAVAAAHSDDAIGAAATLDIAEQYSALGNHSKALATFDHAREVFELSNDQLGQSYLGSAHEEVKLGKKRQAIATLRKMIGIRAIPYSKRVQAQTLLQTLAPVKKKRSKK